MMLEGLGEGITEPYITIMLKVKELSYVRIEQPLIDRVSFALNPGESLLISGKNGVGKTTLIKLISGYLANRQDPIYWQEQHIRDCWLDYCQDRIYLGHEATINLQLTVAENIEFFRAIVPNQRSITNQAVIEQLGLHNAAPIKATQLSAGQRKKLALACFILSAAKLWLLDEPYAALDSVAQQWLTALLQQHVESGGMIILTSHQPIEWVTTATYALTEFKEVNTCA